MRPCQCGCQLCKASSKPHVRDFTSAHMHYAKIWKQAGALSTAVAVVASSVLQRHDVGKSWKNMSPGQACIRGGAHQSLSRLDIGCDFEVTSSQPYAWNGFSLLSVANFEFRRLAFFCQQER